MGLVEFLDFVLKCIKILAWPSFALGYPLYASIRAIERNSDFHMRKLVAYWICFSLISLFEYTFSKLLEWVSVWPFVKILVVCWLVIPYFNGASIAYNNIVRPCLSMQLPQIIVDMLNKKQYLSLTRESFLEEAERYVKENGTEALEKLIASKPIINEPPVAQKDIEVEEILDKSVAPSDNKIASLEADIKVNNMTLPEKLTENPFPVPPAFKNVQKEWTCAACQLTTQSEATLNSHLQGMEHRARQEELKAGKQTATKKGVSTGTLNKERNCSVSQVTTQSKTTWTSLQQEFIAVKQTANKNNSASTTIKSEQPNKDLKEVSGSGINKDSSANQDPKKSSSGSGPNKFDCDICQLKLQSEATLKSHLQGAKHKSKSELKAREATENDKITSSARAKYSDKNTSGLNKVSSANQDPKKLSSGSGPNKFDCDICQLKLQSEAILKSHLQGAKHKSKSELKAREATENGKITSSARAKYSDKNTSGLNKNPSAIVEVTITANVSNGFHSCPICNVTCTSESDMACHLRGKRHLSEFEDSYHARRAHYWCNICDVKCKSEIDMASHLNGTTHDSNLYDSD